ncbi:hypothetical protein [Paenibacillus eucommiae]|uniref:DUF454 family protein n=1 Tax=Paenibacillus eucommiae TaxID=1355755 RepID=A0ABS4INB6_9BACL|nr:hypothetical protein [Paenibacillus eucommiae]MBP1989064.1 hypothetical protein [Paenibacillus eucommiae]
MRRRFTTSGYIILGLLAIGLIMSLRMLIVPICVFGIIFLLYKFPPSKWGMNRSTSGKPGRKKSKNATFRVIQGNKGNDSEDRPKYH